MGWLLGSAAILALAAAVLFSNIRLKVQYIREGKNDLLTFTVKALFGLVSIHYKVPEMKLKQGLQGVQMRVEKPSEQSKIGWSREELRSMAQTGKVLLQNIWGKQKWIEGSLKHVHVYVLQWETVYGAGDAAQTGFASGLLWGLKGTVISILSRWLTMEVRPALSVSPSYNAHMFQTRVYAILRIRLFRLLGIVLMLLWRILREKGGWKVWWKAVIRKKTMPKRAA